MNKPKICAVLVSADRGLARQVEPLADLLEVRIDLIGPGWRRLVKGLTKPWIACNRIASEGGSWQSSEEDRINELLGAAGLGAGMIDIELASAGLEAAVSRIKGRAECLLSYHNFSETPPLESLTNIMRRQLAAGADICKVVTTARRFEDNLTTLRLINELPQARVVSFAMGAQGVLSRVLGPLAGAEFTYASVETGRESASGQLAAADLKRIYESLKHGG